MRTGIRCGVNAAFLVHLVKANGKALGGHRLGKWASFRKYTPELDLDQVEQEFQRRSGGDGLCKKCRLAAERLRTKAEAK